ncbi:MAG: hypothetical protein QNI84_01610 [Henriciella sp.]|nr:hypothetical protein [Henriciella sp.]
MLRSALYSALLALAGCSAATAHSEPNCDVVPGWEALESVSETHIIAIGELHGTNEIPDLVAGLVCQLSASGNSVKLGLEAADYQSKALNIVSQAPFTMDAVYSAAPEMWDVPDGRGSEAILSLLKSVAAWRSTDRDIEVFAFDHNDTDPRPGLTRDETMALNIDDAATGFDGAVIVLSGNYHTRLKAISGLKVTQSMAGNLTARPVVSLDFRHEGGEAFVTISVNGGDPVTGPYEFSASSGERPAPGTFEMTPFGDDYVGLYNVGPITASPPAFPADSAP